jgi:predicted glycogen debranching enzyme
MDAKVGDWVVTPRRGKPVEIQALWYNALCIMEDLARKFGDESGQKRYRNMATVASWSFNRLFWNESTGCLYDVTNGAPPDPSIRPKSICSRRMVCAAWHPPIRNIAVGTQAAQQSVMVLIIKEPCGRGCWDRSLPHTSR